MIFPKFSFKSFLMFLFPLVMICFFVFGRLWNAQEHFFYDHLLQLRPTQSVSSDIAIIEIDDNTLNKLGQWPLPRDFHASMVDVLTELGAKAIVFDLIFSEPSPYDEVFAKSIKNNGKVYLPEVYYLPNETNSLLNQSTEVLSAITPKLKEGIARGHINVFVDPDGKTRKVPLFIKNDQEFVPQLGLQVACDYLQINCRQFHSYANKIIMDGKLEIPVSYFNEVLVNYPGPWKGSFQHFSYLNVLVNYQQYKSNQGELKELASLKGKVCFIGLTAVGTVDLKASPIEKNYPMTGVVASLFNSIVQGHFIKQVSYGIQFLYLLILYLACLWVGFRFKPWLSLISNVILATLVVLVSSCLLIFYGLWVDLFLPLLIIGVIYVVSMSIRWGQERRKLELLEKEMVIAQKIQTQFLQGTQQESLNIQLALWFKPAKYVAGDFYDIYKIDDHRTGILIGDVSGKGLPAAMYMAQTISLFRIFSRQQVDLGKTLNQLNQELCLRQVDRFATALYCVMDPQESKLTLSSAGHGMAYLYRYASKELEELNLPSSVPLGLMPESLYETMEVNIQKKDKLILFSDGIIEARQEDGQEIGVERLKEVMLKNMDETNEEILKRLKVFLVNAIGHSEPHDDMTFIILSLKP